MLIDSVVQKEAVRNEQMILQYESLIEALPKGSIACRKNGYYYLRYRENGKLYDKYIGILLVKWEKPNEFQFSFGFSV